MAITKMRQPVLRVAEQVTDNALQKEQAAWLAKAAQDTTNVHTMWYDRSPLRGDSGRDANLRRNLVNAYLATASNAFETPANVSHRMWTDAKNLHPLYRPCGEIEIPHSMLARAPVSVHFDGDLKERIKKIPDAGLRRKIEELMHHAGILNIGLRSDITRLLYGLLYSDKPVTQIVASRKDGAPVETNVHVDIDTLTEHRKKTALAHFNRSNESTQIREKLGDKLNRTDGKMPDRITASQLQLLRMHEDVRNCKLPAKPSPLEKAECEQLAGMPQRSWASATPFRKQVASNGILFARGELKGGFVQDARENSLIGMIPGHKDIAEVIDKTHALLVGKTGAADSLESFDDAPSLRRDEESALRMHGWNSGKSTGLDLPMSGEIDPVKFYSEQAQISPLSPALRKMVENLLDKFENNTLPKAERDKHLDRLGRIYADHVTDYFRLGERILRLKPALQEKLDELRATLECEGTDEAQRHAVMLKGLAIVEIYNTSCHLVSGFVNRRTYRPQVTLPGDSIHRYLDAEILKNIAFGILGTEAVSIRSGDWSGEKLEFFDSLSDESKAALDLNEVLPDVLKEIKAMLRPREAEDLKNA